MEYLCNRYHTLMALIVVIMQIGMHWNIHFKHIQIKDKIDTYVIQERNARIILSENIMRRIDHLEDSIREGHDENLTVMREEIEFHLENLGVINLIMDEDYDEVH